jgi:histidyl-tRNA synthetase
MFTPSLPQGTRDFNAPTIYKRNFILNTIKTVFELYGFEPLETPALENIETLLGKYGDEGDKLIFKILNNGLDNPAKQETIRQNFEGVLQGKNSKIISERALKYDLTIPFARYVAMNVGQITMPYKRYQIQPVWRADRPQKGRYREFYQCDVDVVGSKSLLNEVELINIYSSVFEKLGIDVEIKINSRKILQALAQTCGGNEKLIDITVAIDKLDKIGIEKVKAELSTKNIAQNEIEIIEKYLQINGSNEQKIDSLLQLIGNNEMGKLGVDEIEYVINFLGTKSKNVVIDFTLARGLSYYTGLIFEVKAKGVAMGSIGGGGRYDDLTSLFGVPNVPGVGISFGVDRIYDVMEELQLFTNIESKHTKILFLNLGENEAKQAYNLMMRCRANNISCQLFHEVAKFDKQFKYAEKKQIDFCVIIGTKELEENNFVVKQLSLGVQTTYSIEDLPNFMASLRC